AIVQKYLERPVGRSSADDGQVGIAISVEVPHDQRSRVPVLVRFIGDVIEENHPFRASRIEDDIEPIAPGVLATVQVKPAVVIEVRNAVRHAEPRNALHHSKSPCPSPRAIATPIVFVAGSVPYIAKSAFPSPSKSPA